VEAIHNKGLRIALGAFCSCESAFKDLMERRKRKIIELALHVAEEAEHPMNQHHENRRAYDQYAERPKLNMVEGRRTPENPFWTNMSAANIITELMATPRGAGIDRIRAGMEQIINENGLREYHRLFTDGSLIIGNKVGCAIVTAQTNIKKGCTPGC
jgi:hypothetical protein